MTGLILLLVLALGMGLGASTMLLLRGSVIPNLRLMGVVQYGRTKFYVVGYQPDVTFNRVTVDLVRKDWYEREHSIGR